MDKSNFNGFQFHIYHKIGTYLDFLGTEQNVENLINLFLSGMLYIFVRSITFLHAKRLGFKTWHFWVAKKSKIFMLVDKFV